MSANLSPLDPRAPEGWRRLGLDETLQAGDMFGYSDNHFEFTIVNALAGKTVREIGVHDEPNWVLAYRAPLVNPSPKGAGDLDQYEKEAPIFDALMIELRGSWPQYEHYANLLNEARGFPARAGDLDPLPVVADAARMRKALERIGRDHDCGCCPCTGDCTSKEALQITVDGMRDLANEALAAQPASAPEAGPKMLSSLNGNELLAMHRACRTPATEPQPPEAEQSPSSPVGHRRSRFCASCGLVAEHHNFNDWATGRDGKKCAVFEEAPAPSSPVGIGSWWEPPSKSPMRSFSPPSLRMPRKGRNMGKVRVPKEDRPPTRFGVIDGPALYLTPPKKFRVSGSYRFPRKGEWFWNSFSHQAQQAWFDFEKARCVILIEVD